MSERKAIWPGFAERMFKAGFEAVEAMVRAGEKERQELIQLGTFATYTLDLFRQVMGTIARCADGDSSAKDRLATEKFNLASAWQETWLLASELQWPWIADLPPAFEPRAISAVEGLLLVISKLFDRLKIAQEIDIVVRCRWVRRQTRNDGLGGDLFAIDAALRCEIAAMLLRPPISEEFNLEWNQVFAGRPHRKLPSLELPPGWSSMSEAERIAALGEEVVTGSDSKSPSLIWLPDDGRLEFRGALIRDYSKRRAPNQEQILSALQRAGWPHIRVPISELERDKIPDAVTDFNEGVKDGTIKLTRKGRSVGWKLALRESDNRSN